MKKFEKLSLSNVKNKLSRAELKNIMAGSGGGGGGGGSCSNAGAFCNVNGACDGCPCVPSAEFPGVGQCA